MPRVVDYNAWRIAMVMRESMEEAERYGRPLASSAGAVSLIDVPTPADLAMTRRPTGLPPEPRLPGMPSKGEILRRLRSRAKPQRRRKRVVGKKGSRGRG